VFRLIDTPTDRFTSFQGGLLLLGATEVVPAAQQIGPFTLKSLSVLSSASASTSASGSINYSSLLLSHTINSVTALPLPLVSLSISSNFTGGNGFFQFLLAAKAATCDIFQVIAHSGSGTNSFTFSGTPDYWTPYFNIVNCITSAVDLVFEVQFIASFLPPSTSFTIDVSASLEVLDAWLE